MEKTADMSDSQSTPSNVRQLTRREWVQRMMAGAGAGIAAPALAVAKWGAIGDQFKASTQADSDWKPAFFDETQDQTLILLCERILPGSSTVQVNRFLDLAMAACTQENQRKFVAAMNAIEGESLRQFAGPFKSLVPAQQDSVLRAASTGKPSVPNPPSAVAQSLSPTLRDHFDFLKDWISSAYYSTEIGMKELGWTENRFFESFPGEEIPLKRS